MKNIGQLDTEAFLELQSILNDKSDNPSPVQLVNRTNALELFKPILDNNTQVLNTVGEKGRLTAVAFLPEGIQHIDQLDTDSSIIFFAPGGSKNQASLWAISRLLARQGIPVVTWDPRGKGFSSGSLRNVTVDDYANDGIEILQQHFNNRPVILAGHSLGGTIAKEITKKVLHNDITNVNISGIINHASSELDPMVEIVRNLRAKAGQILPAIVFGVSEPITLYVPEGVIVKDIAKLNNAVASQESIGITKGMSDNSYINPQDAARYGKRIPVAMIAVEGDEVFPLNPEVIHILGKTLHRPGIASRTMGYESSQMGPVKTFIEPALGHSIITTNPEVSSNFVVDAYRWILGSR